ncbi:predicted protein [Naegleria gruberi]|uniref:Predicted protein n=1 Tax=Naegleria gruberi TaxID=5762 RepID=D2V4R7_NAEGR|nr:uncharacterized protein NAEGRDRAFT_57142 [Naegleria gruberi]EFC47980.1 predicted protein [Naegleria gruberi]|eukprot:XP_002680724.1 predicted protein [Naegleria gruberi strain NEG-M]
MDTTASDSEIAHSIINLSSSSALIGSSSSQISDQQALQDFSLFVQRTDQETASTLPINDHESPVEGEKPALRKGRPSRKKGRLYKQTENLEDFPEPMPIPTVGSSRRGKKVKSQSPSSPPSYQPVFSQAVVSPPPFLQPPSSSNPQSSQYPQPYSPYILSSPPSSSKKRSKSNASDDEYEEGRITFSHTLPPLTIPQVRVPPGTQPVYIVVPVPMYHPHPTNYSQQQQQQQQQQYQEQDNSSDSDYQASIIEDEIEERTPTKRNYEKKRKIDEEEKIEEMKRKRIEIDDNNDSLFDRLVPGEGILYRRRRKLNTKHKADEANGCSDRMYSLFPKISTCCGKTKSLAYNGSQAALVTNDAIDHHDENNSDGMTKLTSPQTPQQQSQQQPISSSSAMETGSDSSSPCSSPTSPTMMITDTSPPTSPTDNLLQSNIKRKKSVTFHPKIVTSSRLLSPATPHIQDEETDDAVTTPENDPSNHGTNSSIFFKHPFWLVNAFQKSWRAKLQDMDEEDENSPNSLTLEKVMSRSIDIESPIWYFIPKKLITKYSSSPLNEKLVADSQTTIIDSYDIEESVLDPKYEVYFNYWAQLRDTLFLKLRKENRKKSEKNSSNIQLWHGYHNAAILSFFIETQRESLCDLQKAIHFRIFDLLFESIAQNTAEKEDNVTVISDQELTLMKTVCFLYIETDHLFHASSVLYHIIRNYCFTPEIYQKLVQKWNKASGTSSSPSSSTANGNNENKAEAFPAVNMDWKVIYLVLRLISKYIEHKQNNSQRENFTSLSQYEEYCKVGKGFSQLSIDDLTFFRSAIIEIICKFKPNHDLYSLWKGKWEIPESAAAMNPLKFPKLESEQEILENCFYILHLVISKERERMVSEKESPATNLEKDSIKDFIRGKPSENKSSLTLMGRLRNWLHNLKSSLRRTNWRRLIMYIAGIVGIGIITKMIYQFFSPRSTFIDERNDFSLSRNELHLPYLTNTTSQTFLPSPSLHQRTDFADTNNFGLPKTLGGQVTKSTTSSIIPPPISTLGTNSKQHPENLNLSKDNIQTILKPSTFKEDFYKKIESPNKQPTDIIVERDFNYITSLRNEMDHVFDVTERMKKPTQPNKVEQPSSTNKKPIVTFQVGEQHDRIDDDDLSLSHNKKQSSTKLSHDEDPSNYTPKSIGDELPPFTGGTNSNLASFIGTEQPVLTNKAAATANNRLNNLNRTVNATANRVPRQTPRKTTNTPNTTGPKVFGKRKQNL